MQKIFSFIICLSMFLFLTACSKSKPNLKYGMWEMKAITVMVGVPMAMPAVTYKQCLSHDEFIPTNKSNNDCVVKEKKVYGNKVIWKSDCKSNGTTSSGFGEVIFNNDTLIGRFDMMTKTSGKEMKISIKMTGKRIGECK